MLSDKLIQQVQDNLRYLGCTNSGNFVFIHQFQTPVRLHRKSAQRLQPKSLQFSYVLFNYYTHILNRQNIRKDSINNSIFIVYLKQRHNNLFLSMQARSEHMNVIEKTAIFENELTQEQRALKLQLCYVGPQQQVNLTLSLKISNAQRIINNSQVFYMDPSAKVCQFIGVYPFNDDLFIEVDPKFKHKLHFKFRKIGGPNATTVIKPVEVKEPCTPGPRKSGERTIGEVKQFIQHKNQIYRNLSQGGQYCTLQQAADLIGLPKKTLDDYERHVRLAESYGFDFEKYRHMGMGVLRNFVKQQSKEGPPVKQQFMQPGCFLSTGKL